MPKGKLRIYLPMYANFTMLSFSMVLANFAAKHPFLSMTAITLYFGAFSLLGIYAFFWQQILKHLPLTEAYLNRVITIPLGMIWGALLFGEAISLRMILCATIILLGVALVINSNE